MVQEQEQEQQLVLQEAQYLPTTMSWLKACPHLSPPRSRRSTALLGLLLGQRQQRHQGLQPAGVLVVGRVEEGHCPRTWVVRPHRPQERLGDHQRHHLLLQ
jgi:hypothetical protein